MRVVFVCTGNTCRSPLAAAILRLEEPSAQVASAGVAATPGAGAAREAIELAAEMGADLSGHRARTLTEEMVAGSLVLALTRAQRDQVRRLFPEAHARIFTLGEYAGRPDRDVRDPVGLGMAAYREALADMRDLLQAARRRLGWLFLACVGVAADAGAEQAEAEMAQHLSRRATPAVFLEMRGHRGWMAVVSAAAGAIRGGAARAAIALGERTSEMAVAANRFAGVRAVAAIAPAGAAMARRTRDANLLCLDAHNLPSATVGEIAGAFLDTPRGQEEPPTDGSGPVG